MSWLILLALLKKLDKKIDDLETVTFRKVDELPATGEANVIYFVPKETAEEGNYSDEYIWDSTSESYEQIGDSMISTVSYKDFLVTTNSGSSWSLRNNTAKDIFDCIDNGIIPVLVNSSTSERYNLNAIDNYTISFIRYSEDYGINFVLSLSKSLPDSTNISVSRQKPDQYITSYSENAVQSKSVYNALLPKVNYSVLAPDYSTSSTYDLGDLVIYNNNLYECTTAIATAEAWTAAHWTQKKLSEVIDEIEQLPSVTSSDEGKVLTVNSNGQWVASTLPDGTNQQY